MDGIHGALWLCLLIDNAAYKHIFEPAAQKRYYEQLEASNNSELSYAINTKYKWMTRNLQEN